jgi:type I restriction enzyme S subunit
LASRENFALVRSQNVFDRHFEQAGLAFITDAQAKKLSGSQLYPGDVLLNITGDGITFGRTCIVMTEILPACVNQHVAIIRVDRTKCDPRFLLSYLTHPSIKQYIEGFNSGGSRRAITKGHIESFVMPVPPLIEQTEIASILSALDDKIELNRRMNEMLEAMARAIFKDWFVDFGPTRAKMEGRAPYLAADIWSLFPDRLDEEGKPEGWNDHALDMLATQHTASVTPSSTPDEVFEHFSLPAYDAGKTPSEDRGDTIKSNKTRVPEGSILLSKLNPEIERVWLLQSSNGRSQVCSTEFLVFTPKANSNRPLLFGLFTEPSFRAMLQSMVTGTSKSHQRISPPALLGRQVLVGSNPMFTRYGEHVELLLDRVLANRAESRTLAATRDLLLPKLMSGEIRVKDAETLIEEVA